MAPTSNEVFLCVFPPRQGSWFILWKILAILKFKYGEDQQWLHNNVNHQHQGEASSQLSVHMHEIVHCFDVLSEPIYNKLKPQDFENVPKWTNASKLDSILSWSSMRYCWQSSREHTIVGCQGTQPKILSEAPTIWRKMTPGENIRPREYILCTIVDPRLFPIKAIGDTRQVGEFMSSDHLRSTKLHT